MLAFRAPPFLLLPDHHVLAGVLNGDPCCIELIECIAGSIGRIRTLGLTCSKDAVRASGTY